MFSLTADIQVDETFSAVNLVAILVRVCVGNLV